MTSKIQRHKYSGRTGRFGNCIIAGVITLTFTVNSRGGVMDTAYNQSTTIEQIAKDYNDNELAADQRYKGKTFTMGGHVAEIGKSEGDMPYVVLHANGANVWEIRCYFDNPSGLLNLKRGNPISVRGEVDGRHGARVVLKHCVIPR